MKRIETAIPGVYLIEPQVHGDARGYFMETYNARAFESLGIRTAFVQDNESRSSRGVLRGLHYQLRNPQAKLVRALRGRIFDVVVDIRRGSPTFGKSVAVTLTEETPCALFVPEGFAHGFYVLSATADITYKCSAFYAPEDERGLRWNDPAFGIPWPIPKGDAPTLSARDLAHPIVADAELPSYAEGGA